ncbi:asparagine synthase-related protein [Sphingomonas hankookensis]
MMIASSHAIPTSGSWIVGSLFRRGEATPLTEATLRASFGTVSAASELTRGHWGDYVAFGTSRDGRYAVRAPFGSLSRYWQDAPDHVILASSVRLLGAFGGSAPAVDWHAVGQFLAATDLRNGRTCLRGVEELAGGQAIEVYDRGIRLERHWSPWSWTDRAQAFHTRDAAAEALAGAIDTAVVSRLPVDVPAILLLSGGLDSSVVAAALASNGRRFTCLTMVVADAQGDERDHAGPWRAISTSRWSKSFAILVKSISRVPSRVACRDQPVRSSAKQHLRLRTTWREKPVRRWSSMAVAATTCSARCKASPR